MFQHLLKLLSNTSRNRLKGWWYRGTDPRHNYPIVKLILQYGAVFDILGFAGYLVFWIAKPAEAGLLCLNGIAGLMALIFLVMLVVGLKNFTTASIYKSSVLEDKQVSDQKTIWRVTNAKQ
jgi:hypothetical protein